MGLESETDAEEKIRRAQSEIAQSLSFAILCALKPAGTEFSSYHQKIGEIRYSSDTFEVPVLEFMNTPFHFASNIAKPLSELVSYEMRVHKRSIPIKDSFLGVFAKYPFLFVTYGLTPLKDFKGSTTWDSLEDITFTHFLLVGGKTRVDNDAIGFVISQESQPGVLLEAVGFAAPTSIIAPGYSDEHIDFVKKQENICLSELLKTQEAASSFIDGISELDTSKLGIKVVYGVSTAPFNNIDKVISQIALRKRKKRILKQQ